jgi:hypothetical protein
VALLLLIFILWYYSSLKPLSIHLASTLAPSSILAQLGVALTPVAVFQNHANYYAITLSVAQLVRALHRNRRGDTNVRFLPECLDLNKCIKVTLGIKVAEIELG